MSMVLLGLAVFGALIGYAIYQNYAPSVYDDFAQCLTEQGAQMYGASWCPHCLDQKELFGSAFRHIDYIECSSSGQSGTLDLCPEITSVPQWFGAEVALPGGQSLEALGEAFGCELPEIE